MQPTLIYVHEFLGNETSFRRVDDILPYEGKRFAFSEEIRTIDGFVDELQEHHDSVRGDKVLVGASLGSMIISKFIALKNPEDLKGLVMVSPTENFSNREQRLYRNMMRMLRSESDKDSMIDYSSDEFLNLQIKGRMNYLFKKKTQRYFDEMCDLANSFVTWDVSDDNGGIGLPVLLICGDLDNRINKNKMLNMSFSSEKSQIDYVQDVGHAPHIDKPYEVAELIEEYIRKL